MSYTFYALPEEQRTWLCNLTAIENVWCVGTRWDNGFHRVAVQDPKDVLSLSFAKGQHHIVALYLGRHDLSPPIWQQRPNGDIDFVHSRAIQCVPCLMDEETILLEGRIGILRPSEYTLQGIDPGPLTRWYRKVRRSLAAIMMPDAVLIHHTTLGTVKECRGAGLTPGAVAWRQRGCLLKQFAEGPVEFDVRVSQIR
jgi:hypothetical protein